MSKYLSKTSPSGSIFGQAQSSKLFCQPRQESLEGICTDDYPCIEEPCILLGDWESPLDAIPEGVKIDGPANRLQPDLTSLSPFKSSSVPNCAASLFDV